MPAVCIFVLVVAIEVGRQRVHADQRQGVFAEVLTKDWQRAFQVVDTLHERHRQIIWINTVVLPQRNPTLPYVVMVLTGQGQRRAGLALVAAHPAPLCDGIGHSQRHRALAVACGRCQGVANRSAVTRQQGSQRAVWPP